MLPGAEAPLAHVVWREAWRIIASRYPPIDLFERLTPDTRIWEALITLESRVNPRLRDEIGEIALVDPDDRVTGPGASWVMAAFTHVNPQGSRFSDGRYGVYYCADHLGTAIRETVFHFERFAADAADPPREEDMRVLVGTVDTIFHDVRALAEQASRDILHPDDYSAARAFARPLREEGSNGILYPSVRDPGGLCIAAFKPKAVSPPRQERHLRYRWNGARIDKYFDYSEDRWISL